MIPAEAATAKALQLRAGMEALGVVMSFVCREQPFSEFRAGTIMAALQHQLSNRCHLCLVQEERLVAYAGWLPIRASDGERWLRGEAELKPVPAAEADAVALTILSVAAPALIPVLLRACRPMARQCTVYFKRDYGGGRMKKSRIVID